MAEFKERVAIVRSKFSKPHDDLDLDPQYLRLFSYIDLCKCFEVILGVIVDMSQVGPRKLERLCESMKTMIDHLEYKELHDQNLGKVEIYRLSL